MTPAYLTRELSDLDMLLAALEASEHGAAIAIVRAMHEDVTARIAEAEGPRYISYPKSKLLAVLTGWTMYPPMYWKNLNLENWEADEFISELQLEGTATLRGVVYRRSEKSKTAPRVTASDRKRKHALCAVR